MQNTYTLNRKENPIKTSIFVSSNKNKLKFIEKANIKLVDGFIHYSQGISFEGNDRYKFLCDNNIKNENDFMRSYRNKYDIDEEAFLIEYQFSAHKWGRIKAKGHTCLSVTHRPTRHRLANDYYIDIDMSNAHPSILYNIAKINNNEDMTTYLSYYINNRNDVLKQVMEHHKITRDKAKQLFLRLMFGGSYDYFLSDQKCMNKTRLQFVVNFETELKYFMNIIFEANKKTILADLEKTEENYTENEAKRSVLGLWCQTWERVIQEASIKYLVDEKGFDLKNIVPCQDGFMILKDLNDIDIIEEIQDHIKNTFQINMLFEVKGFDEKIDIPEYIEPSYGEWSERVAPTELAKDFKLLYYDDCIIQNKVLYTYYDNKWHLDTDLIKFRLIVEDKFNPMIKNDIEKSPLLDDEEKFKIKNKIMCTTNYIKELYASYRGRSKDTEQDIIFNKKPFLLPFKNGVYDLVNGNFRPINKDDYLTLNTGYDYRELTQEEQIIKNELLHIIESIQPEPSQRKLMLQSLASGLDGKLYQKIFLNYGTGGNGKGLLSSLMLAILGPSFAKSAGLSLLTDIQKSEPNSSFADLEDKRYIVVSETNDQLKLANLRQMTGGTQYSVRGAYALTLSKFELNSTLFLEFNNIPTFDTDPQEAEARRMIKINFPRTFTSDKTKIGKKIGNLDYIESNEKYEDPEWRERAKLPFLHILLEIYRYSYSIDEKCIKFDITEEARENTKKFLGAVNVYEQVINGSFQKIEVDENKTIKDKALGGLKQKSIWLAFQSSNEYKNLSSKQKSQYTLMGLNDWLMNNGYIQVTYNKQAYYCNIAYINDEDDNDNGL